MIKLPHCGIKLNMDKEPALSNGIYRDLKGQTVFVPICSRAKENFTTRVQVGDKVKKYQVLAEDNAGEFATYSPFDGTIMALWDMRHPIYKLTKCVEIKVNQPEDSAGNSGQTEAADIDVLTPDTIIATAKRAAITDELDLTRLYDKLLYAKKEGCRGVAIVANDDQPYMSSGTAILLENVEPIVAALGLLARVADCESKSIITYGDVSDKLPEHPLRGINVIGITGAYPFVSEARACFKDGVIYIGVQAALALYNACAFGRSQVSCVVTVDGDCVKKPMNIEVGFGTPIAELIDHCGVKGNPGRIIVGGPMTGRAISPSSVIFPGTTSITVTERSAGRKAGTCIGCGRCVSACPQKLAPVYAFKDLLGGNYDSAFMKRARRCVRCGLCSYVCPAGINVKRVMGKCAQNYSKNKK